ncbi:MAG: hypothetical protein K0R67_892 [Paenibacillus sp.]|nr:hypothetical protein [Paenibacillus sp.]
MTEQDKQPLFPPQPEPKAGDDGMNRSWNEMNMNHFPPQGLPFQPYAPMPLKRKFAAGFLSFLVPGTGHFYLGLMQRGILVMLTIILDIFAIVQLSLSANANIPLITLFSLLIPVIYFYSIFDALQLTDRINARRHSLFADPNDFLNEEAGSLKSLTSGNRAGWLLIGVGALFFVLSRKPAWLTELVSTAGSYIGAVILIIIGVYLFLRKK